MKKLLLLLLVGCYSFYSSAQEVDTIGSGRAIVFDGVDDYINLGNVYDDLSLPVTISVWVNVSEDVGYAFPVFNSQDNLPIYNGVTFAIHPKSISIQYGDGKGENNPAFRRGKTAVINDISGRWVNVTAVMRGASDMDLFLNGMNMGGSYSGSSALTMDSDSPGDDAKIGYWFSNGITTHFKGLMDELRIYNRSLSADEIRQHMCKRLSGNEAGLIGYWDFNETTGDNVLDKSANQFHGKIIGSAQRVFSGAPLGDESAFLYSSSWTGKELSKDEIRVSNIKGTPFGVHIYSVNSLPSQTGGLPAGKAEIPYYGVFLADDGGNNTFDFSFTSSGAACNFYQRNNNSEPNWNVSQTFLNIFRRIEIIPTYDDASFNVDLGPDLSICDQPGYLLNSNSEASGRTYLWSTGQTTPSISVNSSGKYSLQVREGCKTDSDTIQITFLQRPPDFSLGPDEELCTLTSKTLSVDSPGSGYTYQWHDGSTGTFIIAKNFGTYWLKIQNECGFSSDSVTFKQKSEPDFTVNLGPDRPVCDETTAVLQAYPNAEGKTFLWNNGATTPTITVNSSGTFSVQVSGECIVRKDTVHLIFQKTPAKFSLGSDEDLCTFKPKILAVDLEGDEFDITWQDGSSEKYFLAETFGTYSVKVENTCGAAYDSITFTQVEIEVTPQYNFISPDNEDNFNQTFVLDEEIAGLSLTVFNRWGKKVYHAPNYDNRWSGGDLPTGVYYYIITGGCIEPYKGSLTIMR